MLPGSRMAMLLLAVLMLCSGFMGRAGAQEADEDLQRAVALYENGDWEQAAGALEGLLDQGRLSQTGRTEAFKTLAFTYILLDDQANAVETFKEIVREDPEFDIDSLGGDEASADVVRYFGQAVVEVLHEEREKYRATLMGTSRIRASLRSMLLPGWGQLYQGYTQRAYVMMGAALASGAYAVLAESAYRTARDEYTGASAGSDFNRLYDDYTRKADRADLALGLLGAVWLLNVIDAATQGPNVRESEEGLDLTVSVREGVLQVACCARF